ncbi:MAG: hypothetical protein IKY76_01370 [Alistipes sp.]|nr:hypothetical protein [Alistipes sp.]
MNDIMHLGFLLRTKLRNRIQNSKFKIQTYWGWQKFFRSFVKQALRLLSEAAKSHPCGGLKFKIQNYWGLGRNFFALL